MIRGLLRVGQRSLVPSLNWPCPGPSFRALEVTRIGGTDRNAILRLGAKEEGILRNHMVMPDGRVRDSVLFSITTHEWAGVKQNLSYKLANRA